MTWPTGVPASFTFRVWCTQHDAALQTYGDDAPSTISRHLVEAVAADPTVTSVPMADPDTGRYMVDLRDLGCTFGGPDCYASWVAEVVPEVTY